MPLSWNEIRYRAIAFSNEWAGAKSERAEKQTFWNEFFEVFGIRRRVVATFEEPVKKISGEYGSIDLFWRVPHSSFFCLSGVVSPALRPQTSSGPLAHYRTQTRIRSTILHVKNARATHR